MSDKISEVFDVTPTPKQPITTIIDSDDSLDNDSTLARQNIRDILATGTDALTEALEVARASENPRAYEVVATLMKTLSEINTSLIDIHERQKKMTLPSMQEQTKANVTNNIAFVGTTTELNDIIMKRLEQMK